MTNSLPNVRRGRLLVVSGPSGVGKDVLLERVLTRIEGITKSVSATTRPPRPGEIDGQDYYFLSHTEFEQQIAQGQFFEYAQYGDNLYGTPRSRVEAQLHLGLDVVLKIEVQGAKHVRELVSDAVLVFIQPPSLKELERRLRSRNTDSEERIRERLAIAGSELAAIPDYDYLVTNDDLSEAVAAVCAIVTAERHRISRCYGVR